MSPPAAIQGRPCDGAANPVSELRIGGEPVDGDARYRVAVSSLLAGGFRGVFSLEYEAGPLNGVEGSKYLYKEVLAALTTPAPVI